MSPATFFERKYRNTMNKRQLEYFLKVYEHKSVSKAAAGLFITPQALSKTLSSLEKELGTELFTHKSNQILPTPQAALLAAHAKTLIMEYDLISNHLFSSNPKKKNLFLPCSYDVPDLFPASFFHSFGTDHTDTVLKIVELPDTDILARLDNGDCELAIISGPLDATKYQLFPLVSLPFCLVVHKNHPLAENSSVSVKDLKDIPLVIKDSANPLSNSQYCELLKNGAMPDIVLESSDSHLIHKMVIEDHAEGLSLLYLAKKIRSDRIRILPFQEHWFTKTLYLASRKNAVLSYSAAAFSEAIKTFISLQAPE
jgi:DNA-binding transcriptional LysR family regulator